MSFEKYLYQFTKDADTVQTHLSFNKGKYKVPDENYDEFYKKYFDAMKLGESLYLIEKVYNSNFAFFLDLDNDKNKDYSLNDTDIKSIISITNTSIDAIFENAIKNGYTKCIVSKRDNKYHINYYNLIVNSSIAREIVNEINKNIQTLESDESDYYKNCIDTSVYRTGLRLIGSFKSEKESGYYKIYDIEKGEYIETTEVTFGLFMKTVVRTKISCELSLLKDQYKKSIKDLGTKNIAVKSINNTNVIDQITKLLTELKLTNECLSSYDMTIERICAAQNKLGMFCYYISISQKYCPFKERVHERKTNPIYIELSMSGIYIKCYDQECLRRRFPEDGIKLPVNFDSDYGELYMSMSTKYWKSELVINDEIKKYLEESLSGSHYQIAKTAFQIYKDRFRVDDIKNTSWFEFDGVRWKQSHLMNILISEELTKYYRGIKISDTSLQTKNLQEFLVNSDKLDANLRNQMVDNIITKLENVTFKNNILNQLTYLYKTHDPNFNNNLDANPYLLGFKNGVYDFKQKCFRQSNQNDYITFSTGYDYIDYDESHSQVQEIYDFLSKIITNTKVREYLLKVLGKSLLGIPDEKFYIWTGLSGANGKSTLVNFIEQTLGDYSTSVDVSLLTNKRANSIEQFYQPT